MTDLLPTNGAVNGAPDAVLSPVSAASSHEITAADTLGTDASRAAALEWAHPLVREWFFERFESATEPQELGWPEILSRRATLISAPTGSGKTLAAFLACIDRLVRKALTGALLDETEVLYISPLKALGNDIQKNLEIPLGEILRKAGEHGLLMPEVRVGVRTGDTLMHERRAMLKRPPHILVTTPESLYILLTAEKSRANLRKIETVIVDEIHAVADDKRGAHLALSLERLEALLEKPPVRIGLSATQKPIDRVARFLAGSERPAPVIVNTGHGRVMDLAIEVPTGELSAVASNQMWEDIYNRIADLVRAHRSTIVFVNTRRLSERVSHHLTDRLGKDAVAAHHGSLSRKLRLAAERKLKAGEVKVLVATASLELGIDIGFVDLACQIGSPRSIGVTLQRIGRAGHWRGAIPKGRIFATTRDELLECAALVKSIRGGDLDALEIPVAPLDVMAQQIVAACAAEEWLEDDLFALVRRAYPYRELPREEFDAIVRMLSDGISSRRGRYGAYLFHDRVNHRLRGRRGSRLAAITSGGAIPENALYSVVASPDDAVVGTVDEDFAVESLAGDIILLGNTSWRIRRVQAGRVLVEDAHGAAPSVPFWRGEAPGRTTELSLQLSDLRMQVSELAGHAPAGTEEWVQGRGRAISWLMRECGLDAAGAEQSVDYVLAGRGVLGVVPSAKLIVAERFFDESGGMQLVIHSPLGARINKAWGLALRKRFCRSFNFELQAAATDNGLNISLGEHHSFPLADVFHFLNATTVQEVLEQAVLASPLFTVRWRWVAGRALALLRFMGGKKVPPQIQRMRAEDLLAATFPQALACQENIQGDIVIPDHPLIRETMRDVLTEALDIEGLKQLLRDMEAGRVKTFAVDTPTPSPFCHEILNANPYAYLDDAPLEERRARAVEMRRILPEKIASEFGRLDPAAIDEVRASAWPDVRDADELHDALCTLVAISETPAGNLAGAALMVSTPNEAALMNDPIAHMVVRATADWSGFFDELRAQHRVTRAVHGVRTYWVCAEQLAVFLQIFPGATVDNSMPRLEAHASNADAAQSHEGEPDRDPAPDRDAALVTMVGGWMSHVGPVTARELGGLLGFSEVDVDGAMLRLESTGNVLRGQFTGPEVSARRFNARQLNDGPGQFSNGESGESPVQTPAATEWCDRRLLARIHRLTLGQLRKSISAVSPAQFMRWLLRWQHVTPGTQLSGERGTLEVIRQLQGFEAPANAWEAQILKRRIVAYSPDKLDHLCLTGIVGWARLSPHPATRAAAPAPILKVAPKSRAQAMLGAPQIAASVDALELPTKISVRRVIPTSVAPISFFVRDDADWMLPHHAPDVNDPNSLVALSATARAVYQFLQQRGASFFADIVRGTGKLKTEVETGLWELVAAGLLTADGFDNLRALIDPRRRAGQGNKRIARPRHSTGRWSLVYPAVTPSAPLGESADGARVGDRGLAPDRNTAIVASCQMLLHRYGVVFREVLARESILPPWRELLNAFRRMEDRGEVRGGRFISDFMGEQFALPEAVESLRAMRSLKNERAESEVVTLSSADPLNMTGIVVPGARVAVNSGRIVTFRDGVAVDADPSSAVITLQAAG
jgi:ATP-dependent Lhr-like helicase